MSVPAPHFLLFSESRRDRDQGTWRFVLHDLEGGEPVEAADTEPEIQGERLELLAVVRGLEALPQPARVTLVTPSRYVSRGLTYGLAEWRGNGWKWEHFGQMAPIKNRDLWQRLDRALEFHAVDCRLWRFDSQSPQPASDPNRMPLEEALTDETRGQLSIPSDDAGEPVSERKLGKSTKFWPFLGCNLRRLRRKLAVATARSLQILGLKIAQFGLPQIAKPWMK